ncbi:MAG TPA: serine hydrolase domain-containing protein [Planctomycetaceae bacterium]|nr:serine hydrolase domain-containing protein [Planctomycetaceae bacterium]
MFTYMMNGMDNSPGRELYELFHSSAFSGVVSVTIDGQQPIEYAGGLANRAIGRPNTLATRFATASVGKMFTAVCIGRLVDAGCCKFEDLLGDIVPSVQRYFDQNFSLASLLSHRSGLGDYLDDDAELPFAGMDVSRLTCPQAFLPYVLQAPRHEAGQFRYSSAGFVLLGLAIESLTEQPYPAAIAKWVTEPADMRLTGFPSIDQPPEDLAVGYLANGSPNIGHVPSVGGPDGGIVTNAEDLRQFFRCLSEGRLLSDSTREFLWRSVSPISSSRAYGHGFYLDHAGGQTWYGHTGSDPGVSTRVACSMTSQSSIIALCNCESAAFSVFRLVLRWLDETIC